VARLFSACNEVRYEAGDVIVRVGEDSVHFYFIDQGTVHVMLSECKGDEPKVLVLGSGECFGETALMRPAQKRGATVIAASRVTLLSLPSHRYYLLFISYITLCIYLSSLFIYLYLFFVSFWDVMDDEGLAHRQVPSVQVDLAKVQQYRPFLRDSLSRSSLFSRLQTDQIESLAATIKEVPLPSTSSSSPPNPLQHHVPLN